ncbi:UDP-galactose-4-epimerase [Prevotella sp. P5-126]|uniref:NAD-dependent epimerase/dehydratase family protein n=1 Tax=Prevotella sp. P5-126 TaxID=2024216 RepID=UPI000B96B325|nr:NAD-dependent epimerase/dehydratase family protein [Prevotella sp. P5-126]OYP35734.1 UDP-galactose-4-epimerase [Prevotella sp. P5-126]
MEKLLYTGGTGFLGFNTKPILDQMYEVTTIGITDRDVIKANFAKEVPQLSCRYDIVLHAAGKAHINPKSQKEIQSFYDINYQGTVNLCKALENVGVPKSFIFISTCGVYGIDNGNYVTEDYPLAGEEPYQKSKIMAEEFLTKWCEEHSVILGILRPSLMAGKNAPGNLGAMVNGIKTGKYLSINHGKARKSLLMAEDIAYLVPLVAEKGGVYNVCDDDQPSFGELEELIATQLGKRKPFSIPYWMAKCLALVGDIFSFFPINSSRLEKIVNSDTISNEKAKRELGWKPMSVLENYKI